MTAPAESAHALPEIGQLLEVGVAVADLDAGVTRINTLFDASASHVISDVTFGMDFQMCRVPDTDFEVMYSAQPDSLIERFLRRSGEGLHHVAFEVSDAREAMAAFRERGVPPLADEPVGIDNLVAFFLPPKHFGGVLFEFIENRHTWVDGTPLQSPAAMLPAGGFRVAGFGVRVPDLDAARRAFSDLLGARNSPVFVDEALQVKACISQVGDVEFKLMERLDRDVPARPVSAKGALQYVRVEAEDLETTVTKMQHRGIRFLAIGETGGGVQRSRFTDPATCHGLMFEVWQRDQGQSATR